MQSPVKDERDDLPVEKGNVRNEGICERRQRRRQLLAKMVKRLGFLYLKRK